MKHFIYTSFVILSVLAASIYGAAHDQISYTVSPEYFTHLKFSQFNLSWAMDSPRLGAATVGVLASWWMGVIIAIPLGVTGFLFKTPKQMAVYLIKSLFITIGTAFTVALSGLLYAFMTITKQDTADILWRVMPGVLDPVNFARVGTMHEASYLGGILGVIAGMTYLLVCRFKTP